MFRRLVLCLTLLSSIATYGQLHMEANLRNNHLWRGIEVADGLVLTSDVNYTFLNGLVTFGFWGGTNTEGVYKEFNNHLSVQYKGFSFALWDTYNFSKNATYNNEEFFNYSAHSTGRFLDAIVSYRFGEKFPLLVSWATVIFGRDRNEDNTSNKYSTFCYLEYPVYKQDKWRVDVGLGGAFALKQCGSESNFYGDTSGIVHATISVGYDLAIGGYELPVNISTVWNPQADRAFFQIGVRLVSF